MRFPLDLCFLRVPVRTRPFCFPPALCLRSLPHLPCVFICFHSLFSASALRSPARSFPSSPCVQSIFVCVPTPYVSAASPCALVRTVYHIPSSLPLSRDVNQLVTCTCRVQFGCSGHPHTHISHSHTSHRELLDDLTPSHIILRHYRLIALISRSKTHQRRDALP